MMYKYLIYKQQQYCNNVKHIRTYALQEYMELNNELKYWYKGYSTNSTHHETASAVNNTFLKVNIKMSTGVLRARFGTSGAILKCQDTGLVLNENSIFV